VTDSGGGSTNGYVTVIDTSTNTIAATIGVSTSPVGISWDSHNGDIYVAQDGSQSGSYCTNCVVVISGTSILTTVGVGAHSYGVAFDPVTDEIYVADFSYGTPIYVINDGTNTVDANIWGGPSYADGITYSPYGFNNNKIVVSDDQANTVSVLNSPP
jgi:YVTN family beta-propeller protein